MCEECPPSGKSVVIAMDHNGSDEEVIYVVDNRDEMRELVIKLIAKPNSDYEFLEMPLE